MSTFALKMIALLLMLLDHIGYYFAGTPFFLRVLGRASYPLFLFCMVWGYHHTRNRAKYLFRLYLMGVFMTVFGYLLDFYLPTPNGYGNHNIFVPLFLVGVLISIIETYLGNRRKGLFFFGLLAASQVLYALLPSFVPFTRSLPGDVLTGIVPNLAINEYGFAFIALGVLLYFLRDKKAQMAIVYILFCLWQFSVDCLDGRPPIQWLMCFALPLILRYNGEKGRGMKGFFYVFYPLHTFVLFYLGNFVFHNSTVYL